MSSELDVMVLASQGANALVTEVVRGGWQAVRGAFASFLRRDGQATVDWQLGLIDQAEQAMADAGEAEREQVRQQFEERLLRQLAAYLDRYPEMGDELRAMLSSVDEGLVPQTPAVNAQNNTNSLVIQALGDIDGGTGGINYGVPGRRSEH
ncbi:hypothetical protein [Streptomyces luteireticuli]|uniref:PE domain-containing protein n=1 Tax=Streptomyces luteireticuli TaxID=173858 RepID=A0ABP3IGV0_9ACTN